MNGMVLLDDRRESPGVKFNDCDLIGVPLRIVISTCLLEHGKAEVYMRSSGETSEVDIEEVPSLVDSFVAGGGVERFKLT
mgnify:CR=1 FL=1